MTIGISLSIREYRDLLKNRMPSWMELEDLDLFNYFSLSGHTYTEKINSIIIDDFEYKRDEWTLGELKTDLGIAGTGNYDDVIIDIIEKIDSNDDVFIYTNPNIIILDMLAVLEKKCDDRRNQLLTEMDPNLATVDGLLPFWEAIFQSKRQTIAGVVESDNAYMIRAITELFGQSSSLRVIRRLFEKYGLTDFTLLNSRDDPFSWNLKSASDSVNLHLDPVDFSKIPSLNQTFLDSAPAGKRLFVLCPDETRDVYGLHHATDADDYVQPPSFTPGIPTVGPYILTTEGGFALMTEDGYLLTTNS